MNPILKYPPLAVQNGNGSFTAEEITNQACTWQKVYRKLKAEFPQLSSFLDSIQNKQDVQIVLTGAGSSAYIGDVVSGVWRRHLYRPVRAVPTTDLVTHFAENIITTKPLLLISFARSGNSPESKAVIDIADKKCSEAWHLIITCNPKGKLAELKEKENTYVFLLPSKAEDQGLAMTNSFTSMTLAAALIPRLLSKKNNLKDQINNLVAYGQKIIDKYASIFLEIAQRDFNRVVFLGSGPLGGIAKESHLKVQELTDGRIIGKFDSFLGFRHGPKAIINDQTLLVYLFSNKKQAFRYERDLVNQIADHDINLTTLGIAKTKDIPSAIDFKIPLNGRENLEEGFWAILCALPAQIIGFYKSLLLGLNPDNPSTSGTISRVVKGVTIYGDDE
jgi:tagatose-6-phosphate ketose/aldose isomerase